MSAAPASAMILAAGLGTRMAPLTETRPKPLIEVAGRPLIDHAIARLTEAGVAKIVVNVHHFADQMRAHLARVAGAEIIISDETDALLETGGGLVRAGALLGAAPVYVLNSDSIWIEGASPALAALAQAFDPAASDIALLLAPTAGAVGYDGPGDFHMDGFGRVRRRGRSAAAPFVFTGAMILNPKILANEAEARFSANRFFDRAIAADRLRGARHPGRWIHVGTPAAIKAAEAALRDDGLTVRF